MESKNFKILFVFFLLIVFKTSFATHYRAGEILYEYLGPLTYRATVITYTEDNSSTTSQDSISLNWGDGNIESVARTNGPLGTSGVPKGEVTDNAAIIKNVYISNIHTYPGALPYYIISFSDENRVGGIINMTTSVNVPMYLEDTLRYLPPELFEGNSSPILLNPPIDYANVQDTFYHNPNAYDPDGDSLHYTLVPSLQASNSQVPQYLFPDQFPIGANNNISINSITGEIIWATPQSQGEYNIAILIKEYRNGLLIGTILRDMQILVGNENNDPPQIRPVVDTCIYAGDTLNINFFANDPNLADIVTITANGGPFQQSPSRVDFISNDGNPATASLEWRTICTDIRPQFYEIVIKAEDDHLSSDNITPIHLVDLETWLIHIVAPPPDSLHVSVSGNDIQLNWDSAYRCYDSPDFQYFSVWRKYGCENIDRVACETGLENTDYEMIKDHVLDYNFLDQDADRGHIYSYRIVAHFGTNPQSSSGSVFNKTVSIPSHEICVELPLDLPVITNVSIEETSTTDGVVFIQWSKPLAGVGLVDTLQDLPPYSYELYRSEGFDGASFSLIETFTSNSFALFNDTLFYDSLLNTLDNPYSYKVLFKANSTDTMGETSIASSVFLSISPSDKSLNLSWEENVPWVNEEYTIYKYNESTLIFDSIAVTKNQSFKDVGLINDSTYCYKIRSKGKYFSSGLINPIINFSEETCGTPIDTIPPCPPTIEVSNDCGKEIYTAWETENYQNRLSWGIDDCSEDAILYKIFYSAIGEQSYNLLEETEDTTYIHQLENTIAGCYYVTATDEAGNESAAKDTVCIENCAIYVLPNVFTPNGDGANDFFIPFPNWRFVEKIEIRFYGRWGNLVFETQDPAILWDGTDVSGQMLNDGIYLYNGFYFVRKLNGELEQIPLPPNEKGGGFVHLIRNN